MKKETQHTHQQLNPKIVKIETTSICIPPMRTLLTRYRHINEQ